MKCDCEDCFSCPYQDCILGDDEDRETIQKKKKKSEYDRQYYKKNRERILNRVKRRQAQMRERI